jgi:PKD repeat protein
MKVKFYILTPLTILLFALNSKAQSLTCTAIFDQVINNLSVNFFPANLADSLNTSHQWSFGDGTGTAIPSPAHTYPSGGTYTVKHKVIKSSSNGVVICTDSVTKLITLVAPTPCTIQPNYIAIKDSLLWYKYHFTNTTPNLLTSDSCYWSFGDGTPTSYDVNPNHSYTSPGIYQVCLTINRLVLPGQPYCTNTICKTILVDSTSPVPCNLQAYFTYIKDSINNKKVYFTNQTANFLATDSIRWSFGDGSAYNYTTNPTHTYTQAGTYNVCIRVKRNTPAGTIPCVSEFCKLVIIDSIVPCNLQAYFTYIKDSINNKKVYFTNQTANFLATDSIRWSFGDGSAYNYTTNPTHTYTQAGTYNVCIRVKRNTPAGSIPCVSEFCKLVIIDSIPVCNLVANFAYSKDSMNPRIVYFSNQTLNFLGSDSIRWNFGDGTPYNYQVNPVHTYTQNGAYTVCIRVKRNTLPGTAPCISEICKIVIIDSLVPCNLQAYFTHIRDSINAKKIYFTNQTVNYLPTDSIRWSFGDGSPYNYTTNPTHTYTQSGTYTVCLRVKRILSPYALPCVSEFCKLVVVDSIPTTLCNVQANFSAYRDSTNPSSGLVYFYNQTINYLPTDSIRWNFGDGTPFVNQVANPVHTYSQSGTYTVCLRIKRNIPNGLAPCISEICKVVVIPPVNTNCNYVADFYSILDSFNLRKIYFTNTSTNALGATATWSFGDGTSATGWNAVHTYNNGGAYQVCLKVKYSNTCIKEKCRVVQMPLNTACNLLPYPNPTSNVVNASVHLTTTNIIYTRIINSSNIIVRQQQQAGFVGFNTVTVNVATLPPGIYKMVVNYGNKECKGTFLKY